MCKACLDMLTPGHADTPAVSIVIPVLNRLQDVLDPHVTFSRT